MCTSGPSQLYDTHELGSFRTVHLPAYEVRFLFLLLKTVTLTCSQCSNYFQNSSKKKFKFLLFGQSSQPLAIRASNFPEFHIFVIINCTQERFGFLLSYLPRVAVLAGWMASGQHECSAAAYFAFHWKCIFFEWIFS